MSWSMFKRTKKKPWCTLSVQRLMCSEVKKGSCLRYDSLDHMAWVTIWANSIAASAGLSQPLLDSTSTQAWIRRTAWKHNTWVKYTHRNPTAFYLHLHVHGVCTRIRFLDSQQCKFCALVSRYLHWDLFPTELELCMVDLRSQQISTRLL